MGASISGYWVGITEEQRDSMPGFSNDDHAFASWTAARIAQAEVIESITALGLGPLLSVTTEGIGDDEVEWVTPAALRGSALTLQELVQDQDPRVSAIVASYAPGANRIDPLHEEFARDLGDVAQIAEFAASEEVSAMTLEVNW